VLRILCLRLTNADLELYALVEYAGVAKDGSSKKGKKKEREVRRVQVIGARGGKWLEQATVEDYEQWSEGVRIVRGVWERRVELCCGGEEAPGGRGR
jgi:hypothetical protein